MSFAEREKSRATKGVVASMVSTPAPAEKKTTGRGRPKADRETKQRISLTVFPSIYEDLKKIAYVERKSVSEVIAESFAQYIKKKASVIKEYNEIEK